MNNILSQKDYSYSFDSSACSSCGGKCCIGESGNIWINQDEILALCEHLNMDLMDVTDKYLRWAAYKYSLKEVQLDKNNFACVFFDLEKKQCGIYDVRPKQCRTFPFWPYYQSKVEELKEECPGIRN